MISLSKRGAPPRNEKSPKRQCYAPEPSAQPSVIPRFYTERDMQQAQAQVRFEADVEIARLQELYARNVAAMEEELRQLQHDWSIDDVTYIS